MEPSTYTCRPLDRYCPHVSPCFPHTTMLCHSVRSCLPPSASLHCSLVAIGNLATALPLPVNRTSGSLPRLPTRMTLLTDIATPPGAGAPCRLVWDRSGLTAPVERVNYDEYR